VSRRRTGRWYQVATATHMERWQSEAWRRQAVRLALEAADPFGWARRDPLAVSPLWVNEFPPYHASAYRAEHRISVATGPGRLP